MNALNCKGSWLALRVPVRVDAVLFGSDLIIGPHTALSTNFPYEILVKYMRRVQKFILTTCVVVASFIMTLVVSWSKNSLQLANAQSTKNYSTYIFHQLDSSRKYSELSIYTKWITVPISDGIYAAFDFTFENGRDGYIGTQIFNDRKLAVFSIWDSSGTTQDSNPAVAWCNRFGHEGSGSQCIIDYPWVTGREYKLVVKRTATDGTTDKWEGSITDTVTNQTTLIGAHNLTKSRTGSGFGLINYNPITFHEYFLQHTEDCTLRKYSKVLWRGPYAEGETYKSQRAHVLYNDCTLANSIKTADVTATTEMGAGAVKTNTNGTVLWAPQPTPTQAPTPTGTPVPTATTAPTVSPTIGAECPQKTSGDADCNGTTSITDYAVWRLEYKGGCTSTTLTEAACGDDRDRNGNLLDADFTVDLKAALADYQVWRNNFN